MLLITTAHGSRCDHAIHTLVLVAGLASCTSAMPNVADDAEPAEALDTIAVSIDAADPLERVGDHLDGRVLDNVPHGPASPDCDDLPYERLVDYLDGRVLDVPAEYLVCPLTSG